MIDEIFKTYDIRGIYPEQVNEELAYAVGRAFATYLGPDPEIVLGRDARKASPQLLSKLEEGAIDSGAEVINIELSTTPLLNFALQNYKSDGAVMVTASHNPPEYNGFKMIKKEGLQIYGEEIQKIKEIIKDRDYDSGQGQKEKRDPLPDYLSHVLEAAGSPEDLEVVVDYGNGVGSVTAGPVFEKLGVKTRHLFKDLKPDFPNHLPDPTPENMRELVEEVKAGGADLGVFFDGDGDRAFFVDDEGELVYPDLLVALLVEEELEEADEKEIYFDLRFSKITAEKISKAGGEPVMMRVGNPFYKEKLVKEGGLMGAELSGHVMHKDNYYIDDGLFISLKLMNFLSKKDKSLSELLEPLKKYHQSEEINMEVEDKEKALKEAKRAFPGGNSKEIDGVYIEFEDWWFNLRKSNTEDVVRLRLEADSKELLEDKKEKLVPLIKGC